MTGFYNYLETVMPIKRILVSVAIGMIPFCIVLISGLTSDFVRPETVASRTFSAFSFTGLTCFIIMMSCEEFAIFKTKRELEHLIDDATVEDVDSFDRAEYLHEEDEVEPEPADEDDGTFRPLDFHAVANN